MAESFKVDVLDHNGEVTGEVVLPGELFGLEVNVPLIHQVVNAQLAAGRQGTHATKNRGAVSGSGKKPFKQKGTGRARQGSIRAPQYRGGGVVHGPQPRDYSQKTPKKMVVAALRQSLSDRARHDRIHVVTAFLEGEKPSTKRALSFLRKVVDDRDALVVVSRGDDLSVLSLRNAVEAHVLYVDQLNAYDVLANDDVVFTQSAITSYLEKNTKEEK
jgi:LSU ribosomal protein L4P